MELVRLHERIVHAKKEPQRRKVGNQPICHGQQGRCTAAVCTFINQCIFVPEFAYARDLDFV